ncbi:MAG: 1,2-phenylacetyl-CoA epoxidase subunit PaaC [Chitinophagaceae bacterium]
MSTTNIDTRFTEYLLHLADDALILGHRNSEWCGHGPILEQDIAITNISLDLIGQARNLYQYAASLIGQETTEDTLAYLRDPVQFKNNLLAELPRGDWAVTILRQFFFSNYQFLLYSKLQSGQDVQLAAIAAKSLKEVTYHLRWSSEWVIRLGDGTEGSLKRLQNALSDLWPYTGEFFLPASYEAGEYDPSGLEPDWRLKTAEIFQEAGLVMPSSKAGLSGGKEGKHSPDLEFLLEEMQVLPRTYPGATW